MDRVEKVRELLGTEVRVIVCLEEENLKKGLLRFDGPGSPIGQAEESIGKALKECERIEKNYSRFLDGNQLDDLNNGLGEWVKVSRELYYLIKFGKYLYDFSDGAFNLTVKGVLESWGYDKYYSFKESDKAAFGEVFLGDDFHVKITAPIDLGAIGKGYAIDRMVNILGNFENFCVNAGGDIYARGCEVDKKNWRVLFEHPFDPTEAIGFVDVDDMALACSNPNKRKWNDRHHLVDVRSGIPASEMRAVYVQSKTALMADGFSTALFVMGFEKARESIGDMPVEAMIVSEKGEIVFSEGFKGELFKA